MNTQQYEAFIQTVESGSFSKAAENMGYTQSGISHTINAMETELGVTLLLRDRTGVRLTAEGEQLLPVIRKLYEDQRSIVEKACQLRGLECGVIRIGVFTSVACHWLPALIKNFRAQHPKISFELCHGDYSEIEEWVSEGRVDFGFMRLPPANDFDSILLKHDRLLVILPQEHPLAGKDTFPLEMLSQEPFIQIVEGVDNEIDRIFKKYKITPNVSFKMRDDYAIMSMVENGLGISILPELVLHRSPYHIVKKELSIPEYRHLGIITKKSHPISTAADSFIHYLMDSIKTA